MRGKRLAVPALAVIALAIGGCSKLVPSTEDNFSAASNMVVTFRDGEQIHGSLAVGEEVTYVTFGRVYRATVTDVGPPDIVLSNAYVQEEYDQYEIQRDRLEDSTLRLRDGRTEITIPRYKIVSVEEVTFDRVRSAQGTLFWGFTTFVLSQILGARL